VADKGVVGTSRGNITLWRSAFVTVLNKQLPLVSGVLQLVQIECNQVIEKETLHLTAKNVELGAENVECVTIPARRTRTRRNCAGPLARS
jgi:hypothetical protein